MILLSVFGLGCDYVLLALALVALGGLAILSVRALVSGKGAADYQGRCKACSRRWRG